MSAVIVSVVASAPLAIAPNWPDVHPNFVIVPTVWPEVAAGYLVTNGVLSFNQTAPITGVPVCVGTWLGPTFATALASTDRLSFGYNISHQLVILERIDSGLIVHEEWGCQGAMSISESECPSEDLPDRVSTPASSVFEESPLADGWQGLTNVSAGTTQGVQQSAHDKIDSRVQKLRADYTTSSNIPFTGRIGWNISEPAPTGARSPDYFIGICLNSATDYGIALLRHATTSTLAVRFFADRTAGGVSHPEGVVPLPPVPSYGDWAIWSEGCNHAC